MKKGVNSKIGFLFILPSLIGILIFMFIPFLDVVLRSFQDEITRQFVAFHNYKEIFTNEPFKLADRKSVV